MIARKLIQYSRCACDSKQSNASALAYIYSKRHRMQLDTQV